jgi:osmotically-inducible protein OsmY
MRSDSELQRAITDELTWDPSIAEAGIGVAVRDGVVTLTGHVASYAQKLAAEHAVERIAGVRAFADALEVRLPAEHERSDTAIALAAAAALRWNILVPDESITAKVVDGWVTLEGTATWQYQRAAAAEAVRHLTGVRGVTNAIAVRPEVLSSLDVRHRIQDALRRTARREAARIAVHAADGKVTLGGTVDSWTARRDAEYAAWSAPGVAEVDDRIVVLR